MNPSTSIEQSQLNKYDDSHTDEVKALLHRESSYLLATKAYVYEPSLEHFQYRSKILAWVDKLTYRYEYDPQVITITMDYIDRYVLQTTEMLDPRTYQLVAMSSLYLAMKLHVGENHYIDDDGRMQSKHVLSLAKYAELSSGQFTPNDITKMEISILHALNWKTNPVTSITFVEYLLKLMRPPMLLDNNNSTEARRTPVIETMINDPKDQKLTLARQVLHQLAQYFTEIVTSLPENSSYFNFVESSGLHCDIFAPSMVAYASILLSMEVISQSALPLILRDKFLQTCLQYHTNFHPHSTDVQELRRRIYKRFQPQLFINHFTTENNIDMNQFYGILAPSFLEIITTTPNATIDTTPPSPTNTTIIP